MSPAERGITGTREVPARTRSTHPGWVSHQMPARTCLPRPAPDPLSGEGPAFRLANPYFRSDGFAPSLPGNGPSRVGRVSTGTHSLRRTGFC
jgi:hypothetical protein